MSKITNILFKLLNYLPFWIAHRLIGRLYHLDYLLCDYKDIMTEDEYFHLHHD